MQITDTILYCNLKKKSVPCEELFYMVYTPFGGCFTFNSYDYLRKYRVFSTAEAGPSGGLLVTLNVSQDEYFNGPSRSAGFKVVPPSCQLWHWFHNQEFKCPSNHALLSWSHDSITSLKGWRHSPTANRHKANGTDSYKFSIQDYHPLGPWSRNWLSIAWFEYIIYFSDCSSWSATVSTRRLRRIRGFSWIWILRVYFTIKKQGSAKTVWGIQLFWGKAKVEFL